MAATPSKDRGRTVAFGHVGLQVNDLDRSIAYYRDVIGLAEVERQLRRDPYLQSVTGYPGVELDIAVLIEPGSGVLLELLEYRGVRRTPVDPATANPGTGHVCFEVDDVDRIYARARAAGERAVSEPVTPTSGRWADGRSVYLLDPDGIRVELVQRRVESSNPSPTIEIESVFLVEVAFAPGSEERRKPYRAAHLERIAQLKGQGVLIEGGAYLDGLSTSVMLIRAANASEARQITEADIYATARIWEDIRVRPFGRVSTSLGPPPG